MELTFSSCKEDALRCPSTVPISERIAFYAKPSQERPKMYIPSPFREEDRFAIAAKILPPPGPDGHHSAEDLSATPLPINFADNQANPA